MSTEKLEQESRPAELGAADVDHGPHSAASEAMRAAIVEAGGLALVAGRMGVSRGRLAMWVSRGDVPTEWCAELERATRRRYTREQLRPAEGPGMPFHKIWPELARRSRRNLRAAARAAGESTTAKEAIGDAIRRNTTGGGVLKSRACRVDGAAQTEDGGRMVLRCPECRTRRVDPHLMVLHRLECERPLCTCMRVTFPHRPGSLPLCEQAPMSDVRLALRQGATEEQAEEIFLELALTGQGFKATKGGGPQACPF